MEAPQSGGNGEGEKVRPVSAFLQQLEERVKENKRRTNGDEGEEERPPLRVLLPDGREVELPASVVHLKSRLGGDVFLIGSAHVSQASVNDVEQVIQRVQPSTVFVELCQSRAGILFAPQPQPAVEQQQEQQQQTHEVGGEAEVAAGGNQREENITTTTATNPNQAADVKPTPEKPPSVMSQLSELLRRRKEGANILHLVISLVFERVVKNVKVMPGSEFRAAAQEGMKYGARIVLGDRPVEITLKRTWSSLSLWEKLKLIYFVVMDTSLDIKEEDIERMKNSDIITEMVKELSAEFPSLVLPLITERDQFLACKLRSCPGDVVVGVVGMGHVAGMVEWWDHEIDLRSICVVPPPGFFSLKRILLLVLLSIFSIFLLIIWYILF